MTCGLEHKTPCPLSCFCIESVTVLWVLETLVFLGMWCYVCFSLET